MLEKTFENPLDSKEIKSVTPKGNQHLTFIGRMNAEAKTSILWPRDVKSQLIIKDPDAGKDWGWEEKGTTEERWLDGITDSMDMSLIKLRDREQQGSLVCCSSWGHKKSDMTEQQQAFK